MRSKNKFHFQGSLHTNLLIQQQQRNTLLLMHSNDKVESKSLISVPNYILFIFIFIIEGDVDTTFVKWLDDVQQAKKSSFLFGWVLLFQIMQQRKDYL